MPDPQTADVPVGQSLKFAMHNRAAVNSSLRVGCVACLRLFKPEDVTVWTDQTKKCPDGDTAVCPHCGVDAVLPSDAIRSLDEDYLRVANQYWFAPKPQYAQLSRRR